MIEYTKTNNLDQLHDQILAVHPELVGVIRVHGEGDKIALWLPEELEDQYRASLEVIVEAHVPIVVVPPNWQQFRASVLGSAAYIRIATSTPVAQALNPALVAMLFGFEQNPQTLPEIFNLWNAIAASAQPTAEEIESLNQIATDCNMPFMLDSEGLMTVA